MAIHKYAVINGEDRCTNIISLDDADVDSFHIDGCTLELNDDDHIQIYVEPVSAMDAALLEHRAKIEFGYKVVEWFGAENIVLNLDPASVGYCLQALIGPKSALEAGALDTAAYLLSQIVPGPGLSQERLNKYVDMINTRTVY